MTQDELARRYWYSRMMNVTARGYRPQAAGSALDRSNEWRAVFDSGCPEDFKQLVSASKPVPRWERNPSSPEYGTWGNVSVWHKFKVNGYENYVRYGQSDETVLDFKFCTYKNGRIYEDPEHCFFATFVKDTDNPYVQWKGCTWEVDEIHSSAEYVDAFKRLLQQSNPIPKYNKKSLAEGKVAWGYVSMWNVFDPTTTPPTKDGFENMIEELSPDATQIRFSFKVYVGNEVKSGKAIYATATKTA